MEAAALANGQLANVLRRQDGVRNTNTRRLLLVRHKASESLLRLYAALPHHAVVAWQVLPTGGETQMKPVQSARASSRTPMPHETLQKQGSSVALLGNYVMGVNLAKLDGDGRTHG